MGARSRFASAIAASFFGEEALVSAARARARPQALEDSPSLALSQPAAPAALSEEPPFAVALARLMGERRERVEDQVEDLAFRDVGGRLGSTADLTGRPSRG